MQHSIMLSDRGIEALIAFSWYRCDTKPNVEIAKHAVSMAKAFGIKRYIASALWCMGMTYFFLGEYYAAYDPMHEAFQLFNDLRPGDCELQRLCCRCGIDLVSVAPVRLKDGDKAISFAHDVEKQCSTISDDLVHAQSLTMLGLVLENYGHRQEALPHLERAKLKSMGSIYNLTDICHSIAILHYRENRLPEALDAVKEAWELAELSNRLVAQSGISLIFGMILFSANRDTEAWKYLEISLMKNSHLGCRSDSAMSLECMGYGYLRRGDYLNAYGAYEAAAENYLGTDLDKVCSTACRNNMEKIKDKQRNPDLNVGFERPYMDKDCPSLFYPAVKTFPNDTTSSH
jgi:tetratricopeptide (TPR) repeat protein